MLPPHTLELQQALEAARLAADFALAEYEAFVVIPDAPAEISTHVDLGCQTRILDHLRGLYPDDGFLCEESTPGARVAGTTGRVWVIDPIDGTRGFARKTGEFSVMIALTIDGVPTIGVVAEPVQDRVTYAIKGWHCVVQVGATSSPWARANVSDQADLAAATLTQSHTTPGKPPKPVVAALQPGRVIETYSAGVKLAQVARGEADLYVNDYLNFNDWDVCAGHVLVEAAGGRVTLFDGSPVTYGDPTPRRRGLVATNGYVHAAAVARLATLG